MQTITLVVKLERLAMTQSAEWALVQVTIALVIVTLLVAVAALLVPMVSEWLKRRVFAPKLQVRYEYLFNHPGRVNRAPCQGQ